MYESNHRPSCCQNFLSYSGSQWADAIAGNILVDELYRNLLKLREKEGIDLTVTSANFLALDPPPVSSSGSSSQAGEAAGSSEEGTIRRLDADHQDSDPAIAPLQAYLALHSKAASPLKRATVVTVMTTLDQREMVGDAPKQLVLGTESKQVLLLTKEGNSVSVTTNLPGVPALLACTGHVAVEYRIYAACRNHKIYQIKRGGTLSLSIIEPSAPVTHLVANKTGCIAATLDRWLRAYNHKGRVIWSARMPASITAVCRVDI